jgi:serine/threonine-protein kinase
VKTCGQCNVNYPDAVEFCPRDGNRLPQVAETQALYDPLIGSTIDGRYTVESLLGQGGMGYVYAARHAIIDKRVAIKVLRADHAQSDESAAQRFLVEAKAASKIGHQNIVDITDFGVLPDGHAYFVMEFLDGPTLGKLVHTLEHLPPLRAVAITIQIARGLAAAHDKQIIHRDLKPENIFVLDRDGQKDMVKIVDFGIAKDQTYKKKLTQAGMVLGTPEYMSPEQATGQPTDHRVDMYALGCILYEMITGEVPFRADTPTKTLTQHAFEKPIPPTERRPDLHIPSSVETIVMRAIQKKPADRYADFREMIVALEKVQRELGGRTGLSSGALKPVPSAPATQEAMAAIQGPGRVRMMAIVGGVTLVLVVGGGLAITHRSAPAPKVVTPVAALPQPVAAPPVVAPAPVQPAQPTEVAITVSSTPEGAEVWNGAERIGVAPVTLRLPRSDSPVKLTLKKAGYRDETLDVTPNKDKELVPALEPKHDRVASSGHHPAKPVAHPNPQPTPPPPVTKRVSDLRDPFAQ